jgi:CheY-like chemotaxis protein
MIDFDFPHETPQHRLLLVEDHAGSAESMGRLLSQFGYDVRIERDGLAAVRTAREFKPEAALIDLSLPSLDGFGVAVQLRAMDATRDTALIAMTGWTDDDHEERARAAGFDSHLIKPITVDALIDALSGTLARQTRRRTSGETKH